MQQSFLKRPFKSETKGRYSENIFAGVEQVRLPLLPQLAVQDREDYHFVGTRAVRELLVSTTKRQPNPAQSALAQLQERTSLPDLSKSMGTSIGRSTLLSKIRSHERKEMMREARNLKHYKEYQQQWEKANNHIRNSSERALQPTLLETQIRRLQVMPNPEKDELVKNYVNSYWEMSLRDNSVILKRHIKGENRYKEGQLEALLQGDEGRKSVEKSIPHLPVEKLSKLDPSALQLAGRNKLALESASCDPSITSLYLSSRHAPTIGKDPARQILKMSYDSSHRFLQQQDDE